MVKNETIFALLQVVALLLPAVAIYLEILSSRHNLSNMDDGIAANYHATRLTFVYILFAGGALILSLASPVFEFLIGPPAHTVWEFLLTGIAIVTLVLALLTFALPIVFSKVGLSDSRSILWPYKNTIHRLQDYPPSRE